MKKDTKIGLLQWLLGGNCWYPKKCALCGTERKGFFGLVYWMPCDKYHYNLNK